MVTTGSYVTPSVHVKTTDTTKASGSAYTIKYKPTLAITDSRQNSNSRTFTGASYESSVALTITDPCLLATITAPSFSAASLAVTDGDTGDVTFSIPSDSVETTNSLAASDLCGTKTYSITLADDTAVSNWAVISDNSAVTARQLKLTVTPNVYTSLIDESVTVTIKILTKFADYPTNAGDSTNFGVTLNPVTCSCAAMAWTAPSIDTITVAHVSTGTVTMSASNGDPIIRAPTSDDSAKASTPAFKRCYDSATSADNCLTTGSYSAANFKYDNNSGSKLALPANFITWTDGS